ncbi:hypothetical protein Baya_7033 [Bagarius yarrelli]|uniref:Apolipoprotein A-II n=1 Tax=Bagarius yarrelli TaxID=175774 RepID=A0A556TZ29_BAGYA|nr:hypothetical protein Baya_7033 [Bagarius yarrelli]
MNTSTLNVDFVWTNELSLCLCELPQPDAKLVEKYDGLKGVFLQRLVNAYEIVLTNLEKLAEGTITGDKAKEIIQGAQENERVKGLSKLATALFEELRPAIEKTRLGALGVYGEYLRPYIGIYLDTAINNAKPILDTVLPAEHH